MGYSDGPAFRKISIAKAPMNKAITSIGGTKLLLRENRHQSPHAAIVRMTVPAYRETVSMPLAPSGQDTCSPTIAQCEWHRSQATSINRLVKPLVIQTAAHRKERLAEFASMCGHFVLFLVGRSAPYLDQRQMIGPIALLQKVVAQDTGVLCAVDAQLLDRGKALVFLCANEIDVRKNIDGASSGYLGLADHKPGVKTLINRRREERLELVTNLRGICRGGMVRLRLGVFPDFQNGELLRLAPALQHFKATISWFLAT